MVNGNGNENGNKINTSNQQKKIVRAAHYFYLISKKKQICTCSTLFCLSLPLFCGTTMPFCMTKTANFLVTHYFYGGIIPVFMFAFIFSLPLIFTLLASPCWPLAFLIFSGYGRYEIVMFFFQRNSSPLFWITRSGSFSVIHVSVNIRK